MKLVTYIKNRTISCGLLTENAVIDIPSAWPGPNPPRTVIEILQRDGDALARVAGLARSARLRTPLASVHILAPIPRPGKVLALAGNYSEHIKEASMKRGHMLGLSEAKRRNTVPRPFIKPATTVIGTNEEIPWPSYSDEIDYEIELAVAIGENAKCVAPESALDYVAGYMIANDVSARSVTFSRSRKRRPWDEFYDWLNGKWADGFCPTGPYLLTADEVADVQNLNLELKVNGGSRQKANTSQMIYPVREIVSFLSHIMTLEPGDIILTGTPAGVAVASGNFLKAGDTIECRIDNLGVLTNTLGSRPAEFYEPLATRH